MIIVSDTTLLSELAKVRQLHLLHDLFGTVIIPQEVLAKQRGRLESVKAVLDALITNGMRISDRLYNQALTLAQEQEIV